MNAISSHFRPRRFGRGLATACLLSLLSCLQSPVLADEISVGGTGAALATMTELGAAFSRLQPQHTIKVVPSMGSGGGIKAALAGALDVAVSARPLKQAETKAGAVQQAYARTPVVFAMRLDAKVQAISSRQLVDIYAGRLERWPDGSRIRLVLRPAGDADSDVLKAMSPAIHEAVSAAEQRPGMTFAVTDQDAADALERTDGGLGTTTLAQLVSEHRPLRPLALDGVTPEAGAKGTSPYPLLRTLHLVTVPGRTSPAAEAFVRFVLSPAARDVLARNGHWLP